MGPTEEEIAAKEEDGILERTTFLTSTSTETPRQYIKVTIPSSCYRRRVK
jgi:hypothetical protein